MNATTKCAHSACNCVPADGKPYCSETCADAKHVTELACQCQHLACQSVALKP
jgi:hypothetical protein